MFSYIYYYYLLCSECIFPYCEKISLSLGESNDTYKYNPYLTKKYTFHPKNTQIIVCPVTGMTKYKYDNKGHRNTDRKIIAVQNVHGLSNNSNNSSLNRTDQSVLRNIDPDMNYLSSNMTHTDTGYFDDQHFREKFKLNKNMSMFHLNIRSIPEHFIELISYLDSLDIVFKIIAISETWLKPYHTEYIIPNYSIEKDIRFFKRGGGVSLYLHCSLQYQLRNDLKIGTDSETINSVFVEIDKLTTGTRQNLIIGYIYRPPWVNLSDYNSCMANTLVLLHSEHKHIFLLGDYNVDLSPVAEINLMTEEFKNILSSEHFFPLINQPTRASKLSHTIIDNIYCNIPRPLEMSDVGILRPYISDHNAIFFVLHDTTVVNDQHSCIQRNFGGKHFKIS